MAETLSFDSGNNKESAPSKTSSDRKNIDIDSFLNEKQLLTTETRTQLADLHEGVGKNSTALEYSKENGYTVKVRLQMNPDGTSSFLIDGKIGEGQKGILAAYGMQLGNNGQIMGFAEGLQQNRTFHSTGEKYDVSQAKVGLNFRFRPDSLPQVRAIDAKITHSVSGNADVSSQSGVLDYGTFIDTYKIRNGFIGAQETQALISGTGNIGQNGEITTSVGASHLRYNDGQSQNSVDAGLKYTHYIPDSGKVFTEVNKTSSGTSVGIGYEGNLSFIDGATWNAGVKKIKGSGGYNDTVATVGISIPFGGSGKSSKFNRPEGMGTIGENVGNFVDSSRSSYISGKESVFTENNYAGKPKTLANKKEEVPEKNYGQKIPENYGQNTPENYGLATPENYGQAAPENYNSLAINNLFSQKPKESYGEKVPEKKFVQKIPESDGKKVPEKDFVQKPLEKSYEKEIPKDFGQKPKESYGEKVSEKKFVQKIPESDGKKVPEKDFVQKPLEKSYEKEIPKDFGQKPKESYGQVVPESYGQIIPENYGQSAPESYR